MRCVREVSVVVLACALMAGGMSLFAQDQGGGYYTGQQLEQLAAPIALYPDSLVTQVCMAATYPDQVSEAYQWVQANPGVSGGDLDAALSQASWDPSVISMCKFPTVLTRLATNTDWGTDLGYAFSYQQNDFLDAVQRMRLLAYQSGNLKTCQQQRVVVQPCDCALHQTVVIEPVTPDVIYVPAYSPTVVYGAGWVQPEIYYPSVFVSPPGFYVGGPVIGFGVGLAVGGIMFGGCDWGSHNVYVNNNTFVQNNIYRNTNVYNNVNINKNVNINNNTNINNNRSSWNRTNYNSAAAGGHGASAVKPVHGPNGFVGKSHNVADMSKPPKPGGAAVAAGHGKPPGAMSHPTTTTTGHPSGSMGTGHPGGTGTTGHPAGTGTSHPTTTTTGHPSGSMGTGHPGGTGTTGHPAGTGTSHPSSTTPSHPSGSMGTGHPGGTGGTGHPAGTGTSHPSSTTPSHPSGSMGTGHPGGTGGTGHPAGTGTSHPSSTAPSHPSGSMGTGHPGGTGGTGHPAGTGTSHPSSTTPSHPSGSTGTGHSGGTGGTGHPAGTGTSHPSSTTSAHTGGGAASHPAPPAGGKPKNKEQH